MTQFNIGNLTLTISNSPAQVAYIRKVFGLVLLGLLVTAAGAQVGMLPSVLPVILRLGWFSILPLFGMIMWAQSASRGPNAAFAYYAFTFTIGLLTAPTFAFYLAKLGGGEALLKAGLLTMLNVSGLAIYTFVSRRDFSFLRGFLLIGLITMIGASVINIFMGSAAMGFGIDVLLALLFNGFILMDLSRLLHHGDRIPPTSAALSLFLDIFNLFLIFLRLGDRR